jgi:Kef-type K+ transport system membrane component KefB/CBS domain-containing protein
MNTLHLDILLILGIGVFGGIIGGVIFQRFRIPQVIGYIVIGIVIGQSGLRIISVHELQTFKIFTLFALGIIGLQVGGELYWGTLKKYSAQFSGILLGEGMTAFALVTSFTALITYLVTGSIPIALAAGFIFGALGSATDPASTLNVLWEYRSAGVLTTTLIAIVALDDALAMTLYGVSTGVSQILLGRSASILAELARVGVEIFGAVGMGVIGGMIMTMVLKYVKRKEGIIAFLLGIILITISLAQTLGTDIIIASMTLGIVLRNSAPERSRSIFDLTKSISVPIYVFFFVLVGARLNIRAMPAWMWFLIIAYCVGRNGGKIIGSWLGGRLSRADERVQKYSGLGLSAQGGVAVGLAVIASQHFNGVSLLPGVSLGETIVFVITATTLIFQILGPPLVKLASKLSGEIGCDVQEEDVIEQWNVADVIDRDVSVLNESDTLNSVLRTLSENNLIIYPVADHTGALIGVISFENIKDVLVSRDVWGWMVAGDVCTRAEGTIREDLPLGSAMQIMSRTGSEQMPVVDGRNRPVGIIDSRRIRDMVKNEIIERKGVPS